jgi:hypothetical protein
VRLLEQWLQQALLDGAHRYFAEADDADPSIASLTSKGEYKAGGRKNQRADPPIHNRLWTGKAKSAM